MAVKFKTTSDDKRGCAMITSMVAGTLLIAFGISAIYYLVSCS